MNNSIPVILIVLGLLGFAAYVVINNPRLLAAFTRRFMHETQKVEAARETVRRTMQTANRPTSDAPMEDQVADLRTSEFVKITFPGDSGEQEYQITARGFLRGLGFNSDTGEFFPLDPNGTSEDYLRLTLDTTILIHWPERWGFFNKVIVLEGEEADEFNPHGDSFSDDKHRQKPGSYSFDWRDMYLTMLDVGYLEYHHEDAQDKLPIKDLMKIKFMVAKTDDGKLVYLENLMTGKDRVWVGVDMGEDISKFVYEAIRATA
jgi:hypothetical protein